MATNSTGIMSNLTKDKSLEEALADPIVTTTSILLLFLMILILFGNVMVIRTVYMTPKLHYPAFYFVVSLAVADFFVGFLVPLSVVYNITSEMTGRWMAGEVACDIWTFANIWFVCASLLNLCVVSWDRYVAVTAPLIYKLRMHGKKVKAFIGMVWSLSLMGAIFYTVAFELSEERRLCITNGLSISLTIPTFIIIYVIPTLFLLFVNGRVLQIARKHRIDIQCFEIATSNISVDQPHDANKNKRKCILINELKTFKTFVIVIGTFVVCWTPFFVLSLLKHFVELPSRLPHVTVILFYVKSGLNPLIYGTHNKELRTAAANSLKKRRRRIHSDVSESEPNGLRDIQDSIQKPNELRKDDEIVPNMLQDSDVPIPNMIRDVDVTIPNTLRDGEPNDLHDIRDSIQKPNELRKDGEIVPNILQDSDVTIPNMIRDVDVTIPNKLREDDIIPNMLRGDDVATPNDLRQDKNSLANKLREIDVTIPNQQRERDEKIPNELWDVDLKSPNNGRRSTTPLKIEDIMANAT